MGLEGKKTEVPMSMAMPPLVPVSKGEESPCLTSTSTCGSSVRPSGAGHRRSGSFQRWKKQMQHAWSWGAQGNGEEQLNRNDDKTTVNLEEMANLKRQWYQIHSHPKNLKQQEPTSLFEQFFIIGLHSNVNVELIEDAFAKSKTWESEVSNSETLDFRKSQHHGHPTPLKAQILFKYPPVKKIAMREEDLPAFCFPGGVKARMIKRTPSMSDLNEVVFGKEHLMQDDLSFIFCLKDSDNGTFYGVCLHVQEIVQRTPGILGAISPTARVSGKPCRFLVSAPRCYCILTRVPFFELHYEMLNSIVAQERLDRIIHFSNEMSLSESIPCGIQDQDQEQEKVDENLDSLVSQSSTNWMESVIPVDSFYGLTGSSARHSSAGDFHSLSYRSSEGEYLESIIASRGCDLERDAKGSLQNADDFAVDGLELCFNGIETIDESCENGHTSPISSHCSTANILERLESWESVYSSVKSMVFDGGDELRMKCERSPSDEKVMGWAKANNNEALRIVCGYHSLPLPPRGSEVIFRPLEHLQPIKYCRPSISSLGLVQPYSTVELSFPLEIDAINARLASSEEALALSIWTTATICRVLPLETVLILFAGALLEKQVVLISPNLGILSSVVLSLIPMIRPFEWQSLLLPILPRKIHDFLDAPVPFIVGIQQKPVDLKIKTTNLIQVNLQNNKVKKCALPSLPRYRELVSELSPVHARLSCEDSIGKRHPVHECNEVQAEASKQFLSITRRYLESLCLNLRSHAITSVQSDSDRVSLLLKESFVDSFPAKDQPFVKLFLETQIFSALSDSRLSCFEHKQL